MFNDAETGLMMRMPCKKITRQLKNLPTLKMRPQHLGAGGTTVVFLLHCLGKQSRAACCRLPVGVKGYWQLGDWCKMALSRYESHCQGSVGCGFESPRQQNPVYKFKYLKNSKAKRFF